MQPVAEWHQLSRAQRQLLGQQPLVVRGLVAHWPLVRQAQLSFAALAEYLHRFDSGKPLEAMLLPPEARGRFFYREDAQGLDSAQLNCERLNFERINGYLSEGLKILARFAPMPNPPGFYFGSKEIDTYFPGLASQCSLPGLPESIVPNLWLGNQSLIAVHNDHSENIACVAAGRRRFVLFPPDEFANLYIVDSPVTPSGRPISAVNLRNPDLHRFPKFAQALKRGLQVELEPGDALYIPTDWWHGVEALAPVNLLVNFWWKGAPPRFE